MSVKSIRKDDVNITASDLGVSVGDKFIVLPPEESFNNEVYCVECCIGDVLELVVDDRTICPLFRNMMTGEHMYEDFSCLARYEENKAEPTDKKQSILVGTYFSKGNDNIPASAEIELKDLTVEQYERIITFINNLN